MVFFRRVGYCLDSDKLGLDLRKEVFRHDTNMFNGGRVASMLPEEASSTANLILLKRPPGLGPFILDTLLRFGAQLANQHLVNFDRLLETVDQRKDDDLLQPYKVATAIASQASAAKYDGYSLELTAIKSHVDAVFRLWTAAASSGSQDSSRYKSPTKKRDSAKTKIDPWREVARAYAEGPTNSKMSIIPNIDAVTASYAYTFHTPKFAFSVAFKDLCSIKARASQDLPITREFAEAMSIVPSFLRALGQCESDYS
jgi:RNA-dependent RNA polymerase